MASRPFRFLRDMLDLDETGKTAGKVVAVNDDADGYELVDAAAASGGAPTTATYITQTPDATLSAEQALSDLATGIVKNTTSTGVLSIAAEGTDYYGPSGTDVALADGGTGASLADPGADRIMFWDDSESSTAYLQAGSGLSLSGTVLTASGSLAAAGNGLTLTGTVLDVVVDDSTLEINSDTLRVKDGGITAAKVAADVATQAELDAHVNDTSAAHAASAISIADAGDDFTATDVEGALAELQADAETDAQNLADHIADSSAAHAASAISVDSTNLVGTGTDAQTVLGELDDAIADHLADATAAHAASAVSVDSTALSGTAVTVQASLEELDNLLDDHSARHEDGGADEISIQGLAGTPTELTNHLNDTADAHAASAITNTPAGNIAAATVQAAINELDSEKTTAAAALSAAQTEIADQKRVVEILVSDPSGSAITTGDGKAYFRVPSLLNGHNLVSVAASVSTASSSGTPTIQIRNATQAADMLSTRITIDESETDSKDATAAAVIDTGNDDVATGDQIFIDVDVAGTGTKGLLVSMTFEAP